MTHDIQAIRSQVEGLDKENQRLQELYPGARARGVAERQVILTFTAVLDPPGNIVGEDRHKRVGYLASILCVTALKNSSVFYPIEYGIIGEGSQISTNQELENTVF